MNVSVHQVSALFISNCFSDFVAVDLSIYCPGQGRADNICRLMSAISSSWAANKYKLLSSEIWTYNEN